MEKISGYLEEVRKERIVAKKRSLKGTYCKSF